jgi:hypothetical protein
MNKVFKIPLIIGLAIFSFSFFYGGLYNEMYSEGLGFNIPNLIWAFFGACMVGLIPFVIALIISYIYYNSKRIK